MRLKAKALDQLQAQAAGLRRVAELEQMLEQMGGVEAKALDQLQAQAAGLRRVAELEQMLEQMGGVEAEGHQDLAAAVARDPQRSGSAQVLWAVVLG